MRVVHATAKVAAYRSIALEDTSPLFGHVLPKLNYGLVPTSISHQPLYLSSQVWIPYHISNGSYADWPLKSGVSSTVSSTGTLVAPC
jgi:hypothetical protein